jgi:GxxExxY protein
VRPWERITGEIIGAAIAVHRELGPGLLESTYEVCLAALLVKRGFLVERQVPMPVVFQGERLEHGYRIDLLVDRQVVVEVKTVAAFEPVHLAQLVTYLKLSRCEVGLLINFNVTRLIDGVRRVLNDSSSPRPPPPPCPP